MRIGIDIDCVCNNLVHEWIYRLNNTHNLNVKYDDVKTYRLADAFTSLSVNELYAPLNDDDFWKSLVPTEYSIEYLHKLIDDKHDVKLITATDAKICQLK